MGQLSRVMPLRAQDLVRRLSLEEHVEGGRFRRVYCSDVDVSLVEPGERRKAISAIHFLLCEGEHSRWHRVASDEAWHYCEGDPLELHVLDPAMTCLERRILGPLDDLATPLAVIPAGHWQTARSLGDYTFLTCLVAPAFDFADFALMDAVAAGRLAERHPALADRI